MITWNFRKFRTSEEGKSMRHRQFVTFLNFLDPSILNRDICQTEGGGGTDRHGVIYLPTVSVVDFSRTYGVNASLSVKTGSWYDRDICQEVSLNVENR